MKQIVPVYHINHKDIFSLVLYAFYSFKGNKELYMLLKRGRHLE